MLRAVLGPGLALAAYLIGSISFALIAGARAGVDLRAEGSGNPGATNVGRVLGKRVGRMVLAADLAKGAIPAGLALALLGAGDPWTAATGVAAVLGHCFPVWHSLRGGKGAATAAGVLLVLAPIAGGVAVVAYVLGKRVSKRASVGSLLGAGLGGVVATAVYGGHASSMGWAIAGLVLVRHVDNVKRLLDGTEPES